MTYFYILNNWCECYNVYSSLERATEAYRIIVHRYNLIIENSRQTQEQKEEEYNRFPLNPPLYDTYPTNVEYGYYIFRIKEGETFGVEINRDHKTSQDVILD